MATAGVYYGANDIALGGILGSVVFCLTVPIAAVILTNDTDEVRLSSTVLLTWTYRQI